MTRSWMLVLLLLIAMGATGVIALRAEPLSDESSSGNSDLKLRCQQLVKDIVKYYDDERERGVELAPDYVAHYAEWSRRLACAEAAVAPSDVDGAWQSHLGRLVSLEKEMGLQFGENLSINDKLLSYHFVEAEIAMAGGAICP